MKLNDEQLSRVISAHEGGKLILFGEVIRDSSGSICGKCCIVECAFIVGSISEVKSDIRNIANWFDKNYYSEWTTEEFLDILAEKNFI